MLKFAADENFNNNIVRGLVRQNSAVDIVRIQDVGLSGAQDPDVLDWAAGEDRLLLTHDFNTITHYAYERVQNNKGMPGVVEVSRDLSIGAVINDLLLLAEFSETGEWEGQILYLPLE